MTNTYTAIIKRDGPWWIGWVEDVPGVNCQEASREELLTSLRGALHDIIELNRITAFS
jgi:predicted RNase H-like HicB family nuclease